MIIAELRNYGAALRVVFSRNKMPLVLLVATIVFLGQWRPAQLVMGATLLILILITLVWRYRDGQTSPATSSMSGGDVSSRTSLPSGPS
ncbi:hypothetical protein [Rathayibacter sp. VKM Ac-2926]|uniref:hypothetical protein n=1 Tax=Rathayibacter sp. VKM Ac-2926 TaxID=2929477 RepID=UPI001FB2F8AB|nr:hypothetical protein [Rathayibacter sp. VKM Ac-2926]